MFVLFLTNIVRADDAMALEDRILVRIVSIGPGTFAAPSHCQQIARHPTRRLWSTHGHIILKHPDTRHFFGRYFEMSHICHFEAEGYGKSSSPFLMSRAGQRCPAGAGAQVGSHKMIIILSPSLIMAWSRSQDHIKQFWCGLGWNIFCWYKYFCTPAPA